MTEEGGWGPTKVCGWGFLCPAAGRPACFGQSDKVHEQTPDLGPLLSDPEVYLQFGAGSECLGT